MYNEHFGLKHAPFRITPDTRLFYDGGGRGEILDALVYAVVSGEGIVKVVGEVGTGKTMLCRMLEERLPGNVEIVYLANPSLKPDDILQAIALEMDLEIPAESNRLKVMQVMQQVLLEKHARNRQVVIFIEEAQSMPIETLEEIRLLSNLETKQEKLLQIVLFGQPELDDNLNRANIRQLKERITHSFYLEPLDRDALKNYVNYRMRAVGYRGPDVFSGSAYGRIARASEGLTRRINILADKALLSAFAADRHEVTAKDVRKAVMDSQFETRRQSRAGVLAMGAGVLLLAGALGVKLLVPFSGSGVMTVLNAFPAGSKVTAAVPPANEPAPSETSTDTDSVPAAPATTAVEPVAHAPQDAAAGQSTAEADPATAGTPIQAVAYTAGAAPSDGPARAAAARAVALAPALPQRAFEDEEQSPEPAGQASAGPAERDGGAEPDREKVPLQGPSAARSDLITQRLQATRLWLEQADNRHYSIQLLLIAPSQERHLEAFLRQRRRDGDLDHVYVYETVIDDRPYLGVLYREFASYSAAKAALENLPGNLRRLGPFIRNVSDVTTVG